jgi:hypothetical protein
VALIIVMTAVVTTVMNIGSVRAQKPQAQDSDEHEQVVRALRRGGYREVAKLKGHYVGNIDPNCDWSLFDLATLTKHSAAVVLGTPTRGEAKLSADAGR